MSWSESELNKLRDKGLKVDDPKSTVKENLQVAKIKIENISIEKNTIEFVLMSLKQREVITGFVNEHKFDAVRNYRFDWAIPSLMIAIEFEGIMSEKSRHTTKTGYSKDTEKYNLAAISGWIVLRYTVLTYGNLERDLLKLIKK